jgi:nicotinamide-nucleotide amidase
LTKKVVADALTLPMVRFADAEETLRERFRSMHREMTPNNLQQADFPEGSRLLPNPNGTAQGCIVEHNAKTAILLPGPPRELKPMFHDYVLPYLIEKSGQRFYSREMRIFGMGESHMEHTIKDIMDAQTNPTIAPYAKTGEVTLRITARCKDDAEGEALVAPIIRAIEERLGSVVYSTSGQSLPHVCGDLLNERNATISVAESCTGGLLASSLVDIPGSSEYFMEGAITYSDRAKITRLSVSGKTLKTYGAVSEECAREMALGMCKTAMTDYALATTGIAGPGGGDAEKPVGLVYVAFSDGKTTKVNKLNLTGDRARIRELSVLNALDLLRRELLS